jgi:predicted dehydrogenase
MINSKKLGKLLYARISVNWHRPQEYYDASEWRKMKKKSGGGALMVQAIHYIDILQWLMGPVASVYSKTDTLTHNIEVEDIGLGIIKFKNNTFGIIESCTSVNANMPNVIEVFGEKGHIKLEGNRFANRITEFNFGGNGYKDRIMSLIKSKLFSLNLMHRGKIKDQIKEFIYAIQDNKKPSIDGEEGLKSLKIILALYKSSELGKEITLKNNYERPFISKHLYTTYVFNLIKYNFTFIDKRRNA